MNRRCPDQRGRCRAFTLVESVISILVVGVMFVAALSVVANSRASQRIAADHARGMLLAEQLMTEITVQAYEEPVDTVVFGREVNEPADTRSAFDDVDDYHGWSASPPADRDGIGLTGLDGWERRVGVTFAQAGNLTNTTALNTGIKLITVTVLRDGRQVAALRAIRTGAKDRSIRVIDPLQVVAE